MFADLDAAAVETDGCVKAEVLASHVYAELVKENASKAIAAQYLADGLRYRVDQGELGAAQLRAKLPTYIVQAIDYVTTAPTGASVPGSGPGAEDE